MALPIKLKVCVINNCSSFEIKVFNDSNDTIDLGSYGFSVGNITITDISENQEYEFDILPFISGGFNIGPNTSEILTTINFEDYQDGEYDILLELLGADVLSNNTIISTKIFSYCAVRCCIDKMWSKYQGSLDKNCMCTGKAYEKVMEAEALYMALKHASSCMNTEAVNEILKKLQRICSIEKCKCK